MAQDTGATARDEWWHKPGRVLLINLREGDEPRIDARALVRDAQRFAATAFCINGGGIVAFYQTRIAGHRISSGLRGRDLLAEVIPAAHAEGLRVLARIDPSCAPQQLAAAHPEWFARDERGNFCEVSGHYVTCPNAGYYHERMVEVVTEILTRYDADGIWNNQGKFAAWDTGNCYCDTCRGLFHEDAGSDIPREDWADPVWRRYNEWRYRRIAAWVKRMHGAIHAARRDAVFISAVQLLESLETSRPGGWDIDYWVPHQDILTFECQRRNSTPWWPGVQAKYLSGLAPDRPRWMTVSYFYPWWRLSAAPEAENRPWIAQQFANGVSSWLHINGGYSELFDRRGLAPMRDVFQRLARWERYFEGARSDAQVAVVFSRYSQDNYGGARPARYVDAVRGYYCALQEAHIPFDVLSDKFLHEQALSRYGVLVLPNAACLTDAAVAAIERFVAGGGGLVATFETGRYDEHGNPRAQPLLARVLGGEYRGIQRDLKSSYGYLAAPADPLLAAIADTDVVPNDGELVEFVPASDRTVPLTLIPPVRAHSGATISIPELSAVTGSSGMPIAVRGIYDRGRVVYFCNQMDSLFYHYGFKDLGIMLANAVTHALGGEPRLEVAAPDYVDVSSMAQPRRRLVHLINMPVGKHVNTGWRHPGRNLVPVHDIRVRLRLERQERIKTVRLATSESAVPYERRGAWLEVSVAELADHEIVVFELD
ncbi:MAG TPA: beta-galactosidase trimerization domain-containing protein [Burkholderiales bacterium]|nr:beta-galactosidase trimerization domain-containing protein [Burkholderiales bacterium]